MKWLPVALTHVQHHYKGLGCDLQGNSIFYFNQTLRDSKSFSVLIQKLILSANVQDSFVRFVSVVWVHAPRKSLENFGKKKGTRKAVEKPWNTFEHPRLLLTSEVKRSPLIASLKPADWAVRSCCFLGELGQLGWVMRVHRTGGSQPPKSHVEKPCRKPVLVALLEA